MAASAEVPAPYDAGKAKGEGPSPDDAVIFVGISLLLGIGSRHLLRGTRVPYTVALLILGIGLGSIGSCLLARFFCCEMKLLWILLVDNALFSWIDGSHSISLLLDEVLEDFVDACACFLESMVLTSFFVA